MKITSKFLSIVFHPIFIPSFFCIILFNTDSYISLISLKVKFITFVSIFFTTTLLPTSFMPLLKHYQIIKSYEMIDTQERLVPLFTTFASYILCFYILRKINFPIPITLIKTLVAGAISLLVVLVISLKWKISAHCTGIAGLTAATLGFGLRYGSNVVYMVSFLVIVTGAVTSARLYLKAHDLMQVIGGLCLGFLIVFNFVYYF